MDNISIRKEDQILMSLVHYFVTKENYSPIFVQGVKDEIWLENLSGPYRVIRINGNRIFNNEQFKLDQFKIKNILRQIKKKTLSFSINALNINLNEDENITEEALKNVDNIAVNDLKDIENNKDILDIFPGIKDALYQNSDGLELIFNVTKDINEKTERENKRYSKIFSGKICYVTYAIMIICLIALIGEYIAFGSTFTAAELGKMGANSWLFLQFGVGQCYRLITYAFLHGGIVHFLCNMYSLAVVGPQVEARFGSLKFAGIYLISSICGALLSSSIYTGTNSVISVGASGAIFGILGAMVYFGLKYRLYFKESLTTRIVPVIFLNLLIGFLLPGIDNAGHIGGFIGGYLAAMAVGIPETKNKSDQINGSIILIIFIMFLSYLAIFK